MDRLRSSNEDLQSLLTGCHNLLADISCQKKESRKQRVYRKWKSGLRTNTKASEDVAETHPLMQSSFASSFATNI